MFRRVRQMAASAAKLPSTMADLLDEWDPQSDSLNGGPCEQVNGNQNVATKIVDMYKDQ